MGIKTALSILLVFVLAAVAFGLGYGAICHSSDAVGASLVGGGFTIFLIIALLAEIDS